MFYKQKHQNKENVYVYIYLKKHWDIDIIHTQTYVCVSYIVKKHKLKSQTGKGITLQSPFPP